MRKLYLITGGTGHLGQNVIRLLQKQHKDADIRVLVYPGDHTPLPDGVTCVAGDVCARDTLTPFFDTDGYDTVTLFHLAAFITIASKANPAVWKVNVEGTRTIMELALLKNIARVVYVSSVHAIPELPMQTVITEITHFSADSVHGQYAKSKAEAAEIVLQFARRGLNVSIVHPSGIIGPGDTNKTNHLTRTVAAIAKGQIAVSIAGGYDFVDVRDVAKGILQCEAKGRAGECYILSGHYITVLELMRIISGYTGRRFLPIKIPYWLVRTAAIFGEMFSGIFRKKPLLTRYSVATLHTNALFSHRKAARELGYRPRPLRQTVRNVLRSLGFREKIKNAG